MELYNEFEACTAAGQELSNEVRLAIKPIIEKYQMQGAKLRQISEVIHSEVRTTVCEIILIASFEKIKSERP